MKPEHKNLLGYLSIFLLTLTIFLSNLYVDYTKDLQNGLYRRLLASGDVIPNTFLPYILLKEKTFDFSPILNTINNLSDHRPYFLIQTSKGYHSAYPIFTGLLALPIYILPILLKKIPELTYHENILRILVLGRVTAAVYATGSVTIFWAILNKISKTTWWKIAFVIFYALGTCTWSVTSRGLWQHTTSQFFISLTILSLLYKKPRLAGGFVGLSVLIRPTNIILAGITLIYVYLHERKNLVKFILAGIPSAIFLLSYNFLTFGSPFVEGYGARNDFMWSTPLSESLPGYLFSPARSFLFISPLLVLSYPGMYKTFRNKKFGGEYNSLYKYLSIGFILLFFTFAKWYTWDGANAFGYRMLSDFLPIVGLLTFEITKKASRFVRGIFVILIIYSIYIHGNAVFFRKARCGKEHNWSLYCLMPPKEQAQY